MALAKAPVEACVRGFSAGSYSGLSMRHLLWRMPHMKVSGKLGGIALPPLMLSQIPVVHGERLLLFHYTSDTLCQWKPSHATLGALACKYCIVHNSEQELRGHYGGAEHSYGHWLDLDLPTGQHNLWHAEIALPGHRDAGPLRLVSWMSCEPPPHIEKLIQELMILFSAVQPVLADDVIKVSCEALGLSLLTPVSWDNIRDAIISGLAVGGNPPFPAEVVEVLSGFLRRLPLPRLVHFLDLILPQMVPVKSPCRTSVRRFSSSYLMEEKNWNNEYAAEFL